MNRFTIFAILGILSTAGCDKKDETTKPAPAASSTPENKETVLSDDDVPVKSDFAEEAEGAINKDNYKSELDKLATDIEKE